MTLKKTVVAALVVAGIFCFAGSGKALAAWGDKELETEKTAVAFQREVVRGAYRGRDDRRIERLDRPEEGDADRRYDARRQLQERAYTGGRQLPPAYPEMKEMDAKTKADLEKVLGQNKDRLIVFYCGFTKCTRSHNGAMWAVKLGYKNVYRQPGGIKAWDEAGYPVEKSK